MHRPLSIYLGYDAREHDAYRVAKHSIERHASVPVLITPLDVFALGHFLPPPLPRDGRFWDIESEAWASTEFARSRFVVPFLQHEGWALFADSDILCLADIGKLFEAADDQYAVMVVKHNHENLKCPVCNDFITQHDKATGACGVLSCECTSFTGEKMDGQAQQYYARKNWSSVILWNCSHPANRRLTIDRLNNWPGRDLHAFKWLQDEEIGELDAGWNYLVGVQPKRNGKKILHYTLGTPDMIGGISEFAEVWYDEQALLG